MEGEILNSFQCLPSFGPFILFHLLFSSPFCSYFISSIIHFILYFLPSPSDPHFLPPPLFLPHFLAALLLSPLASLTSLPPSPSLSSFLPSYTPLPPSFSPSSQSQSIPSTKNRPSTPHLRHVSSQSQLSSFTQISQ